MSKTTIETIGCDLGDKTSEICLPVAYHRRVMSVDWLSKPLHSWALSDRRATHPAPGPKGASPRASELEPAANRWRLPFSGAGESFQIIGVGRFDAASALGSACGVTPISVGGGDLALVQLSLLAWHESPVGPYWASSVGIVAGKSRRGPLATIGRASRPPGAGEVLAAFLRAPRVLFAPTYVIGDMPGGPGGCADDSRAFGRAVLHMEKSHGSLVLGTRNGLTCLHVLETLDGGRGTRVQTGYSLTFTAPPPPRRWALPVPPLLLLSAGLAAATVRAARAGSVLDGRFLVPARDDDGSTVEIATRFRTRPRILDLTADPRMSWGAMVVDRPAPPRALGAVLEALAFQPLLLAHDRSLRGDILAAARRPREGHA